MLVESPGAHVLSRQTAVAARARPLRADGSRHIAVALAAGAGAMALTSSGDALALGVLLGLLAADVVVWGGASLVALASLARWGSTSLRAIGGAQAVLGPAGLVGVTAAALSSWLGGAALVVASPPNAISAVAFGLAGSALVAGPVTGLDAVHLASRAASIVVGIGAAWGAGRWVPRRIARWGSLSLAAASVVCALLGRL